MVLGAIDIAHLAPAYSLSFLVIFISMSSSSSALFVPGNITGLAMTKFMTSLSSKCRCTSDSCKQITCDHARNKHSNIRCWLGPRKMDLHLYHPAKLLNRSCPSDKYTITSTTKVNSANLYFPPV